MANRSNNTLRTVGIILGAAAVVAGVAYYFRDDKRVKKFLSDARDLGEDVWEQSRDYYEDSVKQVRKKAKELV